jgi:phytoene synthase
MSLAPATANPLLGLARLSNSRAFCEQLTRRAARNFYYGLKLLPEPKRSAMFALYAYMRLVDDIADGDDGQTHQDRAIELEQWRQETHAVLAGNLPEPADSHDLWPAVEEMAHTYRLPSHLFDDVIAGQQQDLQFAGFASFEALREYCYRVAGVVGLASIYVWGFEGGAETEALAVDRGIAFQLTNILRDLREDAANDRIYLPADELAQFGVTPDDLRSARGGQRFLDLMRFQIDRAESFYARSAALDERVAADSRPTLITMTEIYRRLLRKVARSPNACCTSGCRCHCSANCESAGARRERGELSKIRNPKPEIRSKSQVRNPNESEAFEGLPFGFSAIWDLVRISDFGFGFRHLRLDRSSLPNESLSSAAALQAWRRPSHWNPPACLSA